MSNNTSQSQWGVVQVVTGFAVGSYLLHLFSKQFTLPYYRGRCSAARGGRRRSSLGSTTTMHQTCSWHFPSATWWRCMRCWKVRLLAKGLWDFDINPYRSRVQHLQTSLSFKMMISSRSRTSQWLKSRPSPHCPPKRTSWDPCNLPPFSWIDPLADAWSSRIYHPRSE